MAILILAGGALGAHLLNRTAEIHQQLIDRTMPARAEALRMQTALVDQETGVRGFGITEDPQFLAPYTEGRQLQQRSADRMRTLLADRPSLLADVEAIQEAADTWRTEHAEPALEAAREGGPPDTAATERGRQSFEQLRELVNQQNTRLDQARADGMAELAKARDLRNMVFLAVAVALLAALVLIAVLLRVIVSRPLRELRKASRRIADGDFSHRIEPSGPADLRELAADVEAMREGMVKALDSAEGKRALLAQQTADLDAQAVELRRSNAELEQFAYVASHDLQEPLRKVASFCQLLEKRYGDKLDERGVQYVNFAVDGAKRMQVLINDLLTFSRVGRLDDARQEVAQDRALDKALRNLSTAVEESDVQIERPDELPEVTGDPTLLIMLWQNLIGNAIKFRAPERPPVVRISCTEVEEAGAAAWQFCVEDNGIGIPEEFAEKVFVVFQRLHSREAYSGTGIGLALCRKIVEHHQGRIWVDSGQSPGTRICFTLPALPAQDDAPLPAPEGATA
ncbi:CHASE3 domain-containing protein [Streptomyces sp. 549]|nr:CHASE3 domain-containing protein [Streptomyces sp. 549]MDK1475822.1 CHASE3 domain-containing protein [Streptomyces sp. 549]